MSNIITVQMADYQIARAPDRLATANIGSCVAVCLYDPTRKLGGLAHVMLPRNKENDQTLNGRYADTAIAELIGLMRNSGASVKALAAKITGGARVFISAQEPAIAVGESNIHAVKVALADNGIPIVSENTGGTWGRSCRFCLETGTVEVTILTTPRQLVVLR